MTAKLSFVLPLVLALTCGLSGQEQSSELQIRVTPASLMLRIGETAELKVEVVDVGGRPVEADVVFFSRGRDAVEVTPNGVVTARQSGKYEIIVRVAPAGQRGPSTSVPVTVAHPQLKTIEFVETPDKIWAGTTITVRAAIMDETGGERTDLTAELVSANPEVATVDDFGHITGVAPGICGIVAKTKGLETIAMIEVVPNPVRAIALTADADRVRTGDVVHFTSKLLDHGGHPVENIPVYLSMHAAPDDNLGPGASGQIEQDGRFVAETPGLYTIVATCGDAVARKTIRADPRGVEARLVEVGHGEVLDVHTSDLWVWEGVDGRDYAVTGTWGANGDALFWDVTDPANIERIASVKADARTVNDVKVSEDGRICVISREGASNRRNGIVILNVEDPRNPILLSTFDDELTGGVHNVFVSDNHVYALSNGRRYDVINIEHPDVPERVGSFELDTPRHSIHDVWVENGLAYSSNWSNGVQIVDVGHGIKGGSPSNPVPVANYAYPSGWNHAAFPYKSERTGKFYVIAGDEAFPFGLHVKDKPTYPRGWFHVIDFTDMDHPVEVARYEVPEAGTHNLWIEDDILYAAYYNGGVRVVDISGELMGDLYRQGREIGWFIPTHKDGVVPNAAMTWGPQPHKGHIFFSDWNSGLWAVKIDRSGRQGRR